MNRYDGYTFKKYLHISCDSTSICHKSILKFYIDSKNILSVLADGDNLWIGAESDGIYRYRVKEKSLKKYDTTLKSIYSIQKDRLGNLWLGEDDGIYC